MDFPNYNDYVKRGETLKQIVSERLYRDIFDLAGQVTSELYKSVESAVNYLHHDSPKLRSAAIITLTLHWKVLPDTEIANTIRSIAKRDSDSNVRQKALIDSGYIYAGTDDVELGELLALKVLDETSDIDSRTEAYHSLRMLQYKRLPLKASFTFPDEVDWPYVLRFLDTSRTPQPKNRLETFKDAFLIPRVNIKDD